MRNNFFEFTWSEYNHFHFYLTLPTEDSEDKNLKMYVGFWKLYFFIGFWPVTPRKVEWELGQISNQYGFSYFERSLMIYRGEKRTLFFEMPWAWQIVRSDLLMPDGKVYHSNRWNYEGEKIGRHLSWFDIFNGWKDKRIQDRLKKKCTKKMELVHYTKDGRKQEAVITFTGEEREWRWKWFTWLPLFSKVERVVDCDSNVELGKKAGSWKGGLMGWSCEWDPYENMESAFIRWYDKWDGN
jgi:hypothetical protein